jgi:hypothetical protein
MRKLIIRLASRVDPDAFDERLKGSAFDTSAYTYSAYTYSD